MACGGEGDLKEKLRKLKGRVSSTRRELASTRRELGGGAKRLTVSHYIIDWILHTNCLITKIYVVVAYKLEANSTTFYLPFFFSRCNFFVQEILHGTRPL